MRDAIQDVGYFCPQWQKYPQESVAAIGEATAALADLPDWAVAKLEAIEGPDWKVCFRLSMACFNQWCKTPGAGPSADWQRLAYVKDCLLWALRAETPPAADPPVGPPKPAGESLASPHIVNLPKRLLCEALEISDETLRTRVRNGEIVFHGQHRPRAKRVRVNVNQFAPNVRATVLSKAAVDTSGDVTQQTQNRR